MKLNVGNPTSAAPQVVRLKAIDWLLECEEAVECS